MFQTLPINIAGPTYIDRSKPLSVQETRNFYHEFTDSGRDKYVIKSFPGWTAFATMSGGNDRGCHVMSNALYRVSGNYLYEVSGNSVVTNRGSIPGSERCIFADDGESLYINTNLKTYKYNSTTNALTQVTDNDIDGAKSVAVINNIFVYTFDTLSVFSDVGQGDSASTINAVGAEYLPDNIVRDYVFEQVVFRFGENTIEAWYNSGVGSPPFEKIQGQVVNVGLKAKHSIAHTKQFIYFLGSDRNVYRMRGGQEENVTTAAIAKEIQSMSDVSDAYGYTLTLDDKSIYIITFPTGNKTFALIEELGENGWFTLSDGTGEGLYSAGSIAQVYDKTLIGHKTSGAVYELSFDSYDQAGTTWMRRRVIGSINADIFGQKGKRVEMSRMEFILESGTGLTTGQGDDPRIMIEASYDGGKSWTTGTWMRVGRDGENIRAEWHNMKSFYNMVVRLTVTDPVDISIYSASIDLRLAGW